MASPSSQECCRAAANDPMVEEIQKHSADCRWKREAACDRCNEHFTEWELRLHHPECGSDGYSCPKCCCNFEALISLEQHIQNNCDKDEAEIEQKREGGDGEAILADVAKTLYATEREMERDMETLTDYHCRQIKHLQDASVDLNNQIAALNLKKPSIYNGEQLNKIGMEIAVQTRLIYDMEQAIQAYEPPVYNGDLIWAIKNYRQKKQDEICRRVERQTSNVFYTSPRGHKLCAYAYLNGQGVYAGKGISVFAEILEGEYDDLAPFPLCEVIGFMLLNQKRNKNKQDWKALRMDPSQAYCHRPPLNDNLSFGNEEFVLHSVAETSEYLVDDTIFIRVKVGVDVCESDDEKSDEDENVHQEPETVTEGIVVAETVPAENAEQELPGKVDTTGDSGLRTTGGDSGLHTTGDDSGLHTIGGDSGLHTTGGDSGLHRTGGESVPAETGGESAMESSGESASVNISGESGRVVETSAEFGRVTDSSPKSGKVGTNGEQREANDPSENSSNEC